VGNSWLQHTELTSTTLSTDYYQFGTFAAISVNDAIVRAIDEMGRNSSVYFYTKK